jgi:hypothetical protein
MFKTRDALSVSCLIGETHKKIGGNFGYINSFRSFVLL